MVIVVCSCVSSVPSCVAANVASGASVMAADAYFGRVHLARCPHPFARTLSSDTFPSVRINRDHFPAFLSVVRCAAVRHVGQVNNSNFSHSLVSALTIVYVLSAEFNTLNGCTTGHDKNAKKAGRS